QSRATLRAPASSRNRRAGVVIEVMAVATPAASMSASDFSGVQSRIGPTTFLAMSAARYGGGVWWGWDWRRGNPAVATCASDARPERTTVAPSAATPVRNSRLTMDPSGTGGRVNVTGPGA